MARNPGENAVLRVQVGEKCSQTDRVAARQQEGAVETGNPVAVPIEREQVTPA